MPLGCAIADHNFRAVFWNPACERIFGFSEAEVLGKTPAETVVPSTESGAIERVHGAMTLASVPMHSANINVTKDGRSLHCRWHNAPLHSPAGEVIGIICIVLDFTEHDLELEASRHREAQVRNALNAAPEAILTLDARGCVQTSNLEAERLFGYAAADLCRQHIGTLLPNAGFDAGALFSAPSGTQELSGLRSDGTRFVAGVSIGKADLPNSVVFTVIIQDLSQLKAAERQQQERMRMESLGRLAGGIAHDFNNLLTVIVGTASLLARSSDMPPKAQILLESVMNACDRASALTTQLLAFSKQQMGCPEPLDLKSVIESSLSLLTRIVGERWTIETRCSDTPCIVRADRAQLEQVLMNLVTNARDAMPDGGVISIETQHVFYPPSEKLPNGGPQADRYVMIAVTDTGAGISPETQTQIFEPFFTTKGAGKGTGLGLATVYGIVEQAGGHVRLHSQLGRGSRFEILLPAELELPSKPAEAPLEPEPILADCSVLLVEDDEQVRTVTARILQDLGLTVEVAAQGQEALKLVSQHSFDVVVTDLVMPGIDGRTLAQEIRRIYPQMPVLFVTGYTEDSVFHRNEAPHNSAVLTKPFSLPALAQALTKLVSSSRPVKRPTQKN